MNALQRVPAWTGARDFVRLVIFARARVRASSISLADIFVARSILRDVVAGLVAGVQGDSVQFVRLLGVDLLGRTLRAAATQQGQDQDGRGDQTVPHGRLNARAAIWGAA